jgi:hypothetical protein
VGAAADCAAALRIALPDARITAARAVTPNDSLRALGQKPHCRVEASVDAETHIVALLPDESNLPPPAQVGWSSTIELLEPRGEPSGASSGAR